MRLRKSIARTSAPRSRCSPWFPHAHTTSFASFAAFTIAASFRRPTGFFTTLRGAGSVERQAKMFVITTAPNPQRSA